VAQDETRIEKMDRMLAQAPERMFLIWVVT
jgi:hypothetical protein